MEAFVFVFEDRGIQRQAQLVGVDFSVAYQVQAGEAAGVGIVKEDFVIHFLNLLSISAAINAPAIRIIEF